MDWTLVLSSAAFGAIVGALTNVIVETIKDRHELHAFLIKELHRILEKTESMHGFSNCATLQEQNDRILYFWGNLEIIKPLMDIEYRNEIEKSIVKLKNITSPMKQDDIKTLDEMVLTLKVSLQNQIIGLIKSSRFFIHISK
jgi:hypothetical protein